MQFQEKIVSELQNKIKEQGVEERADLESLKNSLNEEQQRQMILKDDLVEAERNLDKMKIELQERKSNEEFLETELNKKEQEKEEEQKIRYVCPKLCLFNFSAPQICFDTKWLLHKTNARTVSSFLLLEIPVFCLTNKLVRTRSGSN